VSYRSRPPVRSSPIEGGWLLSLHVKLRRGLETGLRLLLHGHAGGNPGHGQEPPTDYRASSRPYQPTGTGGVIAIADDPH
jgi:hypothetical protein